MAKKRTLEWNIILIFAVGLFLWFELVFPMFQNIANEQSSFIAFSYYLVGLAILSQLFGRIFSKGFEAMVIFLIVFITIDVIQPPLIIQKDVLPTKELLNTWGSDTFLYQIATNYIHLNHTMAWYFTYIFAPILGIIILAYFLSGKALKNRISLVLNSK